MRELTFNRTHQFFLICCLLLISSGAFAGFIDLKVTSNGTGTVLEIEGNDVMCGTDISCIKTIQGEQQDLDFRLKKACKNDGPEYRLSGMQLSMIQREPDGSGNMVKAFGKHAVPADVATDFDTGTKGNVLWKDSTHPSRPNKLGDDLIKLKNRNQAAYVVFFQIEATHCTDPSVVIYLDPRIENTGK
jgi:hypothetical protein